MNSNVKKKVQGFIAENGLLTPGDTVVAAVSGGADSVALLDVLVSLKEYRLNLVAAHLNHLLRGADADADEAFVRGLARGYGVPVVVKREDVAELARRERRSLEDAGRAARYAFFDAVAAARKARVVALGHHADDQAETVLMRLLRGAGGSGLCAMAPKTAGRYVRPLLGLTRREIEDYLRERGIPWRDDESNMAPDFLRNRIRHELLPLLATFNPAVSATLAATAGALAADEECLEAAVTAAFASHGIWDGERVALSAPGVIAEQRGIRMRLYRRAIARMKGDLARIGHRHLQALDALFLSPGPHRALTLPDGLRVARSYDEVSFSLGEAEERAVPDEVGIDGPGLYPLPGGGMLAVDYASLPREPETAPAATVYFDPAAAPFPWRVRTFRPGDRFSPFGMTGSKKVKDLFIDEKVPIAARRRIPLLFCGETLLWVGGMRRSGAAPLTEQTKTAVKVELRDFTAFKSLVNNGQL